VRAAGRGRQSGMREDRRPPVATAHGTCGAGVGAPRTTGTGRDATRAVFLPSLRPKAGAEERRPGRGGRNVAGGIRVVCLRPRLHERIPGGTWAPTRRGVGVKVDEIYGLAEKDFCLASVPTCFCVRLVFVHGEGRRLSTDAGASRTRATPCCFCTWRLTCGP
jgi:hypothetical protein